MTVANVDLEAVRGERMKTASHGSQTGSVEPFERVLAPINICAPCLPSQVSRATAVKTHDPNEEIMLAPALWLWDYLRRSSARGFFLPLSPGVESTSVAAIVSSMAKLVFDSITAGNIKTLDDLRRITRRADFMPTK